MIQLYTLNLLKFLYKLLNNSLPPYFVSYKTLIQPLTDRYPLRRSLYQISRVNHEFARISLKYQFISFLNILSEKNSQFLNTILEHVHIQPFIEYSRFTTNYLNSLYKYECCIRDCYVCNVINAYHLFTYNTIPRTMILLLYMLCYHICYIIISIIKSVC